MTHRRQSEEWNSDQSEGCSQQASIPSDGELVSVTNGCQGDLTETDTGESDRPITEKETVGSHRVQTDTGVGSSTLENRKMQIQSIINDIINQHTCTWLHIIIFTQRLKGPLTVSEMQSEDTCGSWSVLGFSPVPFERMLMHLFSKIN